MNKQELEKDWLWLKKDCKECYELNKHNDDVEYISLLDGACSLPSGIRCCEKHINVNLLKRFVRVHVLL